MSKCEWVRDLGPQAQGVVGRGVVAGVGLFVLSDAGKGEQYILVVPVRWMMSIARDGPTLRCPKESCFCLSVCGLVTWPGGLFSEECEKVGSGI